MNYLLKRVGRSGGGQYVANPGRRRSYTNKRNARRFASIKEAQENRCVLNEVIIEDRGED